MYDENIYNFCARARFPGCTYLRHIILGLNTVEKLVLYSGPGLARAVGQITAAEQVSLEALLGPIHNNQKRKFVVE